MACAPPIPTSSTGTCSLSARVRQSPDPRGKNARLREQSAIGGDMQRGEARPVRHMNAIHALLRSGWLFYLGTIALTYIYWWSGLTKLWDFEAAQAEMTHFGLQPAPLFAAATIALQLAGAALIIFG